jgi:hypothetical protein
MRLYGQVLRIHEDRVPKKVQNMNIKRKHP